MPELVNLTTVSRPTVDEVGEAQIAAAVVSVNDDVVAVALFASVTRTVIACDCGALVGVPVMAPVVELMLRPSGSVPDAMA